MWRVAAAVAARFCVWSNKAAWLCALITLEMKYDSLWEPLAYAFHTVVMRLEVRTFPKYSRFWSAGRR